MPALPRFPTMIAAAVLLFPALVSCSGSSDDDPAPAYRPTPLAEFDADGLRVERADLCDRLPEAALDATVGEVESTGHYGSGESAPLTDDLTDISHEFNCTWTGVDGRVARAWVFVPPVPAALAEQLVVQQEESAAENGCTVLPDAGFGTPSTGAVCRTDAASVATYHGLFGDAWLSCSLSVPDPEMSAEELQEAAGEWCVAVAGAASND